MERKALAVIVSSVVILSILGVASLSIMLNDNDLEAGWNLIAVPVSNSFTAETLAQYIGDCDTVMKWDASTQDYISHPVGTPISNFDIEDGVSYMIHLSKSKSVNFEGVPASSWTVTLEPGWNYLGNIYPASMKAEVFGGLFENCDTVMKWDASTQDWVGHPMGTLANNFDIPVGTGVSVHVTTEQVWHGIYSQPNEYTLTTSVLPAGAGYVSPSGGTYAEGDIITVTAHSAIGYTFDHWEGDATGTSSSISLTMSSDKNVVAYFRGNTPVTHTLTGTIYGGGRWIADPWASPGYRTGTYIEGTMVTLTATPDTGWVFDHWSGDITGTQNIVTITMDSDKTVNLYFTRLSTQYTLTANIVNTPSPPTLSVAAQSHHREAYMTPAQRSRSQPRHQRAGRLTTGAEMPREAPPP